MAAVARWRRKLKRFVGGLAGLVVIVAGLALLALANLDCRPMKTLVRSAARSRGVALDYDVGRVTIGGLRFKVSGSRHRGVKLGARALAVRLDATLGAHGVARGVDARLSVKAASATQSAAPWYGIEVRRSR